MNSWTIFSTFHLCSMSTSESFFCLHIRINLMPGVVVVAATTVAVVLSVIIIIVIIMIVVVATVTFYVCMENNFGVRQALFSW